MREVGPRVALVEEVPVAGRDRAGAQRLEADAGLGDLALLLLDLLALVALQCGEVVGEGSRHAIAGPVELHLLARQPALAGERALVALVAEQHMRRRQLRPRRERPQRLHQTLPRRLVARQQPAARHRRERHRHQQLGVVRESMALVGIGPGPVEDLCRYLFLAFIELTRESTYASAPRFLGSVDNFRMPWRWLRACTRTAHARRWPLARARATAVLTTAGALAQQVDRLQPADPPRWPNLDVRAPHPKRGVLELTRLPYIWMQTSSGRYRPQFREGAMFIYSVTTPRGIQVKFGLPEESKQSHISLLTGPNGSGKTDVLASIAHAFHGRRGNEYGATVHWANGSHIRVTQRPLEPDEPFEEYERVRLIAQTFSPFSRFPDVRKPLHRETAPLFSPAESDDYSCIGFNQSSRVDLRTLAFSIVQKALLRLSERPSTARVAFEVLDELQFKNGFTLRYRATPYLMAFISFGGDALKYFDALAYVYQNEDAIIGNTHFGKSAVRNLRREVRKFGIDETSEFLRHAINMIEEHSAGSAWRHGKSLTEYEYLAFRNRQRMSRDFPYLQAFSVLMKLGLIELVGCELTPITGGRVDLSNASSGQQQMLCSIFGLAAALDDNSIVLIDEPELSLHPRWQMNFFRHLETALSAVEGCHVIIATHSALIAQAAANHAVRIFALGNSDAATESSEQPRSTLNSVEGMLVDVFSTPVPNSLHLSKQILKLVTKAEAGDYWDKLVAKLELERYQKLYRTDGDGSDAMLGMLRKAVKLVEDAGPSAGGGENG